MIIRFPAPTEKMQTLPSTLLNILPLLRKLRLLLLELGNRFNGTKGNEPNLFLGQVARVADDDGILLLNFRYTLRFVSLGGLISERALEQRDVDTWKIVALEEFRTFNFTPAELRHRS